MDNDSNEEYDNGWGSIPVTPALLLLLLLLLLVEWILLIQNLILIIDITARTIIINIKKCSGGVSGVVYDDDDELNYLDYTEHIYPAWKSQF